MQVLMVSTEYPPMQGGIGRYTANLTKALLGLGINVHVICDEKGDGDYSGIYPKNPHNSDVLLNLAKELEPDIVHVQFDPGLYGLISEQKISGTYIDKFYAECKIPIVTTFHSGLITQSQWITPSSLVKKNGKLGKLGIPLRASLRYYKYFLNYKAFNNITKQKLRISKSGIIFSHYMLKKFGDNYDFHAKCHVIYHGSDPAIYPPLNKKEARERLSLPLNINDHRIALAYGFRTTGKGWEILKKMNIPKGWIVLVNSSKDYYNREDLELSWQGANNIVDLQRGFLSEEELTTLFYASDAVILPYKVTAGSGVMFDALAHGLPFVATDLGFFREFAAQGLGITAKRNANDFSKGLEDLDNNYIKYKAAVDMFKEKLKWNSVAKHHYRLYLDAMVAIKKTHSFE